MLRRAVVPAFSDYNDVMSVWCRLGLLACWLLSAASAQEESRQWTSQDGRVLEASLISADAKRVYVRRGDGSVGEMPPERLSEADQAYVQRWVRRQPKPSPLPEWVGVNPVTLSLQEEGRQPDTGMFRWQSAHFWIEAEAALPLPLMRELAACLEAVQALFRELPWGINPAPPPEERHLVMLFASRETYLAAGGPEGSAGVYLGRGRRLLLPLESLGWQPKDGRWGKGPEPQWDILIHELSHQMMDAWLDYLPQWVVEGMAEYVRLLPYRDGRFHTKGAERGLADHITYRRRRVVGGVPPPYPVEKLFALSKDEWSEAVSAGGQAVQSLYFTSYLLVYFFMHVDGAGDGWRLMHYLRATQEGVQVREEFERARREGRPPEKLGVAQRSLLFGRGREEWMTHNRAILLGGRREATLMQQVREAFQRFGLTL